MNAGDYVLNCVLDNLPSVIRVRMPAKCGDAGVRSARVWNYVPERTCHIVRTDDYYWECDQCGCGIDWDSTDPNDSPGCSYCPGCGCRVVGE